MSVLGIQNAQKVRWCFLNNPSEERLKLSRDIDILENDFSSIDKIEKDPEIYEFDEAFEHITLSPHNEHIPLTFTNWGLESDVAPLWRSH